MGGLAAGRLSGWPRPGVREWGSGAELGSWQLSCMEFGVWRNLEGLGLTTLVNWDLLMDSPVRTNVWRLGIEI